MKQRTINSNSVKIFTIFKLPSVVDISGAKTKCTVVIIEEILQHNNEKNK